MMLSISPAPMTRSPGRSAPSTGLASPGTAAPCPEASGRRATRVPVTWEPWPRCRSVASSSAPTLSPDELLRAVDYVDGVQAGLRPRGVLVVAHRHPDVED